MNGLEKDVLEYVALAYASIGRVIDRLTTFGGQSEVTSSTQALLALDGTVGRPSFQISPIQLEFLINNRFSVPQIAQLLGVSVSTIRCHMLSFNMSICATYSFMSDLDGIASDMQQQFPSRGNRQMYGYLLSQNIRVQYSHVRESQSRVDPDGSMVRQLLTLRCRSYSVHGPQHLWHIDGHHKLIRLELLCCFVNV